MKVALNVQHFPPLCWPKIIAHVLNSPSLSEILARFVLDCGVGAFWGICGSFCDFFVLFCFGVLVLYDNILHFIGIRQKLRLKGTSGFDEVQDSMKSRLLVNCIS